MKDGAMTLLLISRTDPGFGPRIRIPVFDFFCLLIQRANGNIIELFPLDRIDAGCDFVR